MSNMILEKTWKRWYPEEVGIKKKTIEQCMSDDVLSEKNEKKISNCQNIQNNQNKQDYENGFKEGYKTGYQTGIEKQNLELKKDELSLKDRMHKLITDFELGLESFDNVIVSHLMQLVLQISRKITGENPVLNNIILFKKIKKIIKLHPILSNKPKLRINPNDKLLIERHFGNIFYHYNWNILYDDNVSQGGCILESEKINLDATTSLLWKQLYQSTLLNEHNS